MVAQPFPCSSEQYPTHVGDLQVVVRSLCVGEEMHYRSLR